MPVEIEEDSVGAGAEVTLYFYAQLCTDLGLVEKGFYEGDFGVAQGVTEAGLRSFVSG